MRRNEPFTSWPAQAGTVVGTGLIALDVVIPEASDTPPRLWAGGTCGNVLASLAYLGWAAYPVARLGHDAPMRRVCQDLATWGVHLDFVLKDAEDSTPVIAHHIRGNLPGGPTHSFSWRCPTCGADLPRYKPLRLSDLGDVLHRLPPADVFFFDRVSPAAILLAGHFSGAGALVVFEPSGVGNPRLFREALASAHVVKFSRERLGDTEILSSAREPWLVIETVGDQGVRYRGRLPALNDKRWRSLPAFAAAQTRDTAGCGDWSTTGILHALGAGGVQSLLRADEGRLSEAFRYGQALAAWNCGFEGARGGMYDATREEFEASIAAVLAGRPARESTTRPLPAGGLDTHRFICSACPPEAAQRPPKDRAS
jgi:fructokinase